MYLLPCSSKYSRKLSDKFCFYYFDFESSIRAICVNNMIYIKIRYQMIYTLQKWNVEL